MPEYPTTRLDRAVQREIDRVNKEYLEQLEAAGPGACPNCLKQGGGWCWCCTEKDGSNARDHDAWEAAQK